MPAVSPRWETRLLGWLEHPVNLMLANLVWFVLVLPVVTWLPATVALVSALDRWFTHGDDRVMRNVVAGWRAHWRRTLPLGIFATLVGGMLGANALFLSTRAPGVATVLLGATGVLGVVWLALHLWLVVVIARRPDESWRGWYVESAARIAARPLLTLGCVVFTVLLVAVLVGFWTIVPFFSANLVVALVVLAAPATDR